MDKHPQVASGISGLDQALGGLNIGDNVIWYDDAGSLAWHFCRNFMASSLEGGLPLIYVTFDRSPKNLVEKLGPLADHPGLVIMDCFTWGKGAGSEVFLRYYQDQGNLESRRMELVKEPGRAESFMEDLYDLHARFQGQVHFVFESLTGMQELWGGEEAVLGFYMHSCPRLYELDTVAYWIMEKKAHSSKLRAQINQIAQVVIDLSIKRGATSLTILKTDRRQAGNLHKPQPYWVQSGAVVMEGDQPGNGPLALGGRLRAIRRARGLSQTELARLVGVTASNISQVESNLINPSLTALVKMAEVLGIDMCRLFQAGGEPKERQVYPRAEARPLVLAAAGSGKLGAKLLAPAMGYAHSEVLQVELEPGQSLEGHFASQKGEELGYVIQGEVVMHLDGAEHRLAKGDVIRLSKHIPTKWQNPGSESVKLLWIKFS